MAPAVVAGVRPPRRHRPARAARGWSRRCLSGIAEGFMETLLRRHMGVVNLIVIAACAALSARAPATAIGGRLGGEAPAAPHEGSRRPPAVAPPADDPVGVITRRNVFCSRCTVVIVRAAPAWPAPPSLRLLA